MKLTHHLLVALLAAIGCSACSPYTLVNSEVYNNADMADYHTFRIVQPRTSADLPNGMEMVTYYNIAAAIRQQLTDRGYVESDTSSVLVNFGVTVHREVSTEPAYMAYGTPPLPPTFAPGPAPLGPMFIYPRPYYWNPNAQVVTGIYHEGVLTVDIVDIRSHLALFSASVSTVIDGNQGRYRNLQGIAQAVETLFSRFPVKPLATAAS